jgi:hypothetical protein
MHASAGGGPKTADLARLKRDLGRHKPAEITTRDITEYFEGLNAESSGGVVTDPSYDTTGVGTGRYVYRASWGLGSMLVFKVRAPSRARE